MPHKFEIDGGRVTDHGKSHWPDGLTLTMDRNDAWRMVKEILAQIEEGLEVIEVTRFGKLTDLQEDTPVKITAIHGGGDWHDASAEYLILPEGMDYDAEAEAWRKWYRDEYCPSLRAGKPIKFIGTAEWLKKRGAIEPPAEMLEVVDDF